MTMILAIITLSLFAIALYIGVTGKLEDNNKLWAQILAAITTAWLLTVIYGLLFL